VVAPEGRKGRAETGVADAPLSGSSPALSPLGASQGERELPTVRNGGRDFLITLPSALLLKFEEGARILIQEVSAKLSAKVQISRWQ